MLSNLSCINIIKGRGMHASHKGKALVERNDYTSYSMNNVPIIPDFKIIFPKGKFMESVHITTYARTPTLAWDRQLFAVLHAVVSHARISSRCHGCRKWTIASSPDTPRMRSA
jgi:hypothetical protein